MIKRGTGSKTDDVIYVVEEDLRVFKFPFFILFYIFFLYKYSLYWVYSISLFDYHRKYINKSNYYFFELNNFCPSLTKRYPDIKFSIGYVLFSPSHYLNKLCFILYKFISFYIFYKWMVYLIMIRGFLLKLNSLSFDYLISKSAIYSSSW